MLQMVLNMFAANAVDMAMPSDHAELALQAEFIARTNSVHAAHIEGHVDAIREAFAEHLPEITGTATAHSAQLIARIQADPELSDDVAGLLEDIRADLGSAAGPVEAHLAEYGREVQQLLERELADGHLDVEALGEKVLPELQELQGELQPYMPQIEAALQENAGQIQDVLGSAEFQQAMAPLEQALNPHIEALQAEIAPHIHAIAHEVDAYYHDLAWNDPHDTVEHARDDLRDHTDIDDIDLDRDGVSDMDEFELQQAHELHKFQLQQNADLALVQNQWAGMQAEFQAGISAQAHAFQVQQAYEAHVFNMQNPDPMAQAEFAYQQQIEAINFHHGIASQQIQFNQSLTNEQIQFNLQEGNQWSDFHYQQDVAQMEYEAYLESQWEAQVDDMDFIDLQEAGGGSMFVDFDGDGIADGIVWHGGESSVQGGADVLAEFPPGGSSMAVEFSGAGDMATAA